MRPVAALDAAVQDQFQANSRGSPAAARSPASGNRDGMSSEEVIQRLIDERRGLVNR